MLSISPRPRTTVHVPLASTTLPPTLRLLRMTASTTAEMRDAIGAQPVGIDVDLVLAHHAADARHLGHARHGVELVADEPVLDRAQIPQRVAPALDGVPEDVADARRVRPERRHDARGQRLREQVEPLEHARAREVEVDVVLEDHVDHREAERRRRADDPHARQPLQAHRERVRDLVLDLLRRAARTSP